MSLDISGLLFSADNRMGSVFLVGVGHNHRYSHVSADLLRTIGLYAHIESVELFTSAKSDANLILLKNDDYSGAFAQVKDARSGGDVWWDVFGHIASLILVSGNKQGTSETRLSFSSIFQGQWNTFLDNKLSGTQASRVGNPTLTWEMFPENVTYLNSSLAYLKIYQPLHISIDWWPDYSASMTYHVYLYADSNHHLRAYGARWAWWVEGGAKSGKIGDQLGPKVSEGLGELQTQLNTQLKGFDEVLGHVTDVYYLPGTQTTPTSTGSLIGNTSSDVTIVIEH
ncbi:MAG: hypothetical protein ACTHK8_10940 [Ginsengibacter sp.]